MSDPKSAARDALTGAILGALCAVAADALGVQHLLRRPELSLYIPTAVVGALLGVTRLRALVWVAGGILSLLCVAVAYTPLAAYNARAFIRSDPLPSHVDAVAVISAGLTSDGLARSETLDRLLSGIELVRAGVAQTMMVSREHVVLGGEMISDSADLTRVATMALPAEAVIFVDSIETTRTEALRMWAIAKPRHWNTIALVTSPLHTKRACATFEAVGFRVICVPATIRQSGLDRHSIPEDRFRAFRLWLYERFATDTYRRRGWIK